MAALENTPMGGVDDTVAVVEPAVTTPPAKRRGGVLSLSMGAAPRTGLTPISPLGLEHWEVASPRQGRPALAGARKRQASATAESFRTLSALPAPPGASAAQILSPGPDASMEELRGFCVTMLSHHDKALIEVRDKMKAEREADNKVPHSP